MKCIHHPLSPKLLFCLQSHSKSLLTPVALMYETLGLSQSIKTDSQKQRLVYGIILKKHDPYNHGFIASRKDLIKAIPSHPNTTNTAKANFKKHNPFGGPNKEKMHKSRCAGHWAVLQSIYSTHYIFINMILYIYTPAVRL